MPIAGCNYRAPAQSHTPRLPADIDQRDGRILRQGNQNPVVEILRYVTEESVDTYMRLVDRTHACSDHRDAGPAARRARCSSGPSRPG
jgi:hypothetical protein